MKLKNNSMGGYDLSNYIKDKFGVSISPGTIYNHLYSLERDEIIYVVNSNTKRIYKITDMGTHYLEILCDLCKKTADVLKQEIELETEKS